MRMKLNDMAHFQIRWLLLHSHCVVASIIATHTHTYTLTLPYRLYVTLWLVPYENVWNFNGTQNDTFFWHIRFTSSKKMHSSLQREIVNSMLLHSTFISILLTWDTNALREKIQTNIHRTLSTSVHHGVWININGSCKSNVKFMIWIATKMSPYKLSH